MPIDVTYDAQDVADVAIPLWAAVSGQAVAGALAIVAPGDCVQLRGVADPRPCSPAGLAIVGFVERAEDAVAWVRDNLARGDVVAVTRTRAILRNPALPFALGYCADEAVWLVEIDPNRQRAKTDMPVPIHHDRSADIPYFGRGAQLGRAA